MMLLEGLSDPTKLTEQQASRLASVGLIDNKRLITQLGKRILEKDQTAVEELAANQAKLMPAWETDWVTQPPRRGNKVFGPTAGCGDMAAQSMGF